MRESCGMYSTRGAKCVVRFAKRWKRRARTARRCVCAIGGSAERRSSASVCDKCAQTSTRRLFSGICTGPEVGASSALTALSPSRSSAMKPKSSFHAAVALAFVLSACAGANGISRPPRAQQWYERALAEFRAVDIEAAHDSARHALDLVPDDEEVRVLAARVALARLEYDEVVRLLKGLD